MEVILVLILLGLIIYLYRSDKKDWMEIYREDEESLNKVQRRIRYLKKNGVRCRMEAPFLRGSSFKKPHEEAGKVKIIVRKKDKEKARALLEEYSLAENPNEQ